MRQLVRGPAPPSLDGDASAGGRELARAKLVFRGQAAATATFRFQAYKGADVRAELARMSAGKCAYCEARYDEVQPVDVEHYRPKSGYLHGKRLVTPGYWWLAAAWENLLPSCIDCNRAREHDLVGPDGRAVAGKASQFPVAGKRARRPGAQATAELPLLLDPTVDNPADFLTFSDDGNVAPLRASGPDRARSEATIHITALRRLGLANGRKAVAITVATAIAHVEDVVRDLDDLDSVIPAERARKRAELRARLTQYLADLETYCRPDARFSAVAEGIVRAFRRRIGI